MDINVNFDNVASLEPTIKKATEDTIIKIAETTEFQVGFEKNKKKVFEKVIEPNNILKGTEG